MYEVNTIRFMTECYKNEIPLERGTVHKNIGTNLQN